MKTTSPKFKKRRQNVETLLKTTTLSRREIANRAADGDVGFVIGIERELTNAGILRPEAEAKAEERKEKQKDIILPSINVSVSTAPSPEIKEETETEKPQDHAYTLDELELLMAASTQKEVIEAGEVIGISRSAAISKHYRIAKQMGLSNPTRKQLDEFYLRAPDDTFLFYPVASQKVSVSAVALRLNVPEKNVKQALSFKSKDKAFEQKVFDTVKQLYIAKSFRPSRFKDADRILEEEKRYNTSHVQKAPFLREELKEEKPVLPFTDKNSEKTESLIPKYSEETVKKFTDFMTRPSGGALSAKVNDLFTELSAVARECESIKQQTAVDGNLLEKTESCLDRRNTLLKALITRDRKFFALTSDDPVEAQKEYLKKTGFSDSEIAFFMGDVDKH